MSKWDCLNCQRKITFDNKRRFYIGLLIGIWVVVTNGIISIVRYKLTMNIWIWMAIIFIGILGAIFISTLDTFKGLEEND